MRGHRIPVMKVLSSNQNGPYSIVKSLCALWNWTTEYSPLSCIHITVHFDLHINLVSCVAVTFLLYSMDNEIRKAEYSYNHEHTHTLLHWHPLLVYEETQTVLVPSSLYYQMMSQIPPLR